MRVNKQNVKNILEDIKPAKLVAATKYVDVTQVEELENRLCFYLQGGLFRIY